MPHNDSHRRQESGLTILEMLCALSLCTLLLVFLMELVGPLSRRVEILKQRRHVPWAERLQSQLRQELLNSRRLAQSPTQLVLIGYAGRDPLTARLTGQPVRITYEIRPLEEVSWLVRFEEPLDELSGVAPLASAVMPGVTEIRLQLPDEQVPAANHQGDVPRRLHLQMLQGDASVIDLLHCR